MKKFLGIFLGVFSWLCITACYAAERFDVLPDLPEPIVGTAAQASSVTTTDAASNVIASQTIGHEPNILSIIFSLAFVILLIYAVQNVYTKLNKMGLAAFRKQLGDSSSHPLVISTTPLGGNKTLHVVELDGKRMLIGASVNSIHLIKDLGSCSSADIEDGEFSKIEIPNIRIPKIEIPKIEIPHIGFTKTVKNTSSPAEDGSSQSVEENNDDKFEISDIYEETENPDGIIDKLFQTATEESVVQEDKNTIEHQVDPDEFVLYKKYL